MDWVSISAISFFALLFVVYSQLVLKALREPDVR